MKTLRIIPLLLLVVNLIEPCTAHAMDIWECEGHVYTTTPLEEMHCKPLKNAVVCGHEGNRYFAPFRPGLKDVKDQSCSEGEKSASPFVNLALADSYAKNPPRLNDGKKLAEPGKSTSSANPPAGAGLDNLGGLDLAGIQNLMSSFKIGGK